MNKGQGTLEMLIGLGGIIIVALIVITMVLGGLLQDTGDTANDNLFAFIDAIEINENNMLENSSFETADATNPLIAEFWVEGSMAPYFTRSNDVSRRGSYSMKATSAPEVRLNTNPPTPGSGKSIYQIFDLAPGTYRIYAYIQRSDAEINPYIDFLWSEESDPSISEICDSFISSGDETKYNQWIRPSNSRDCIITQAMADKVNLGDGTAQILARLVAEDSRGYGAVPPITGEHYAYYDSIGLMKIS